MTYPLEYKREGSGFYENGLAGETLGARKLVYMDANGQWKLADADAASAFPVVGITLEAISSSKYGKILTKGYVGDASWSWATLGASIYASATAGELTQTQPTGATKIQAVALAKEDDLLYFDTGLNREIANFSISDANWEDLRFPASAARLGGANPADLAAYRDGVVLAFASNADEYMYVLAQLPHRWAEGTDIIAHIHWCLPIAGSGGGVENVKWDLTHSWSDIGGAIPDSSALTITRDVQNIAANLHMLNNFTTISGSGKDKSSCLIISIKRDTTVANDYANDVYIIEFDIHYEVNRAGSADTASDTPA